MIHWKRFIQLILLATTTLFFLKHSAEVPNSSVSELEISLSTPLQEFPNSRNIFGELPVFYFYSFENQCRFVLSEFAVRAAGRETLIQLPRGSKLRMKILGSSKALLNQPDAQVYVYEIISEQNTVFDLNAYNKNRKFKGYIQVLISLVILLFFFKRALAK